MWQLVGRLDGAISLNNCCVAVSCRFALEITNGNYIYSFPLVLAGDMARQNEIMFLQLPNLKLEHVGQLWDATSVSGRLVYSQAIQQFPGPPWSLFSGLQSFTSVGICLACMCNMILWGSHWYSNTFNVWTHAFQFSGTDSPWNRSDLPWSCMV